MGKNFLPKKITKIRHSPWEAGICFSLPYRRKVPSKTTYKLDFFLCSRKRRSTDDLQDVFDDDDLAESDDDDDHSDDFNFNSALNFDANDVQKVTYHPNGEISIEFKSAASTPLKKEKGKVDLVDVFGKSSWQSLKAKLVNIKKRSEIQGKLARNLPRRRLITSIRSLAEKKSQH